MDSAQQVKGEARHEVPDRGPSLEPITLTDRIAAVFERTPVRAGAEYVPELLKRTGHEALVSGMYDIEQQLTAPGHTVTVQYFARIGSSEAPLITLSVRDQDGAYFFPNINLRLNPAIPRERHEGGLNQKLTITAEDQEMGFDRKYLPPLKLERFSAIAEVRLLLEESDNPDMPYRITPLFSPTAFLEARQHAVEACKDDGASFSVIFHEQIIPAVAERLHRESEVFGLREVPEIEDLGSNRQGDVLKILSWIPKGESSQAISLTFAVEQDSLGSRVTSFVE